MSGADRARKRAIRERMARTGEPYTLAARRHDEERAEQQATQPPAAEPDSTPDKPTNALDLPFVAPPE